jgi:hypothetical protein
VVPQRRRQGAVPPPELGICGGDELASAAQRLDREYPAYTNCLLGSGQEGCAYQGEDLRWDSSFSPSDAVAVSAPVSSTQSSITVAADDGMQYYTMPWT